MSIRFTRSEIGPELGYAEITSSVTSTAAFASPDDVTGLTITINVGSRPFMLEAFCANLSNSGTGQSVIQLYDTTAAAGLTLGYNQAGAGIGMTVVPKRRLNPAAGSRSYKLRVARLSANGTVTLFADAADPAFIRAVEC
jgi:hypothetical protein